MLITANGSTLLGQNSTATAGALSAGLYTLTAQGTWNSGTLTLEFSTDGTTWTAYGAETTLTANGAGGFLAGGSVLFRVTLASATDSPSLNVFVDQILARK